MRVRFTAVTDVPGQIAAAELHFDAGEPLAGLKLSGFVLWERRTGQRHVTFPAKWTASPRGDQRAVLLLEPIVAADRDAVERVRRVILEAYTAWTLEPV